MQRLRCQIAFLAFKFLNSLKELDVLFSICNALAKRLQLFGANFVFVASSLFVTSPIFITKLYNPFATCDGTYGMLFN
jgi:hypothetical protein